MFALAGFVSFLIGLIINVLDAHPSHVLNVWTWLFLGLALVALHLGTGWRSTWGNRQQ